VSTRRAPNVPICQAGSQLAVVLSQHMGSWLWIRLGTIAATDGRTVCCRPLKFGVAILRRSDKHIVEDMHGEEQADMRQEEQRSRFERGLR